MKYKTKCPDCGQKLLVPTWRRCQECGDTRKKKLRLAYYHKHKDLIQRRIRDWQKRNKDKKTQLKKENDELLARLYKEIYNV